MIRKIPLLVSVFLIGCLPSKKSAPTSKDSSIKIRRALAEASSVSVSEGLPHQAFERDLLAIESKRKDTDKFGSFRFYTPATAATNSEALKVILSSSDTIQVSSAATACGGFHPDYAVHWSSEAGSQFFAQICFSCREIIYSDEKNYYRYYLDSKAFEKLKKEFTPYAKKRPKGN
jgi:hypothetical protein